MNKDKLFQVQYGPHHILEPFQGILSLLHDFLADFMLLFRGSPTECCQENLVYDFSVLFLGLQQLGKATILVRDFLGNGIAVERM